MIYNLPEIQMLIARAKSGDDSELLAVAEFAKKNLNIDAIRMLGGRAGKDLWGKEFGILDLNQALKFLDALGCRNVLWVANVADPYFHEPIQLLLDLDYNIQLLELGNEEYYHVNPIAKMLANFNINLVKKDALSYLENAKKVAAKFPRLAVAVPVGTNAGKANRFWNAEMYNSGFRRCTYHVYPETIANSSIENVERDLRTFKSKFDHIDITEYNGLNFGVNSNLRKNTEHHNTDAHKKNFDKLHKLFEQYECTNITRHSLYGENDKDMWFHKIAKTDSGYVLEL